MQHLSITRIMIAHRKETIAKANIVLRFEQGNLLNISAKQLKESA